MSDLNPKAVYQAYKDDQKSGPLHRPLFLARILAISVACLGAIPTGYNLYQSWSHGIPYGQVSHRLDQYSLWVKNFECKIEYRTVSTGQGTKVDVGACPKSNDIALKLTTASGKASYEWIAFDQLEKSNAQASLLLMFGTSAHAEGLRGSDDVSTPGLPQLAQASAPSGSSSGSLKVNCEARPTPSQIVRVITDGGKCYREHIQLIQGRVEKREEVPCNTQCSAGKG